MPGSASCLLIRGQGHAASIRRGADGLWRRCSRDRQVRGIRPSTRAAGAGLSEALRRTFDELRAAEATPAKVGELPAGPFAGLGPVYAAYCRELLEQDWWDEARILGAAIDALEGGDAHPPAVWITTDETEMPPLAHRYVLGRFRRGPASHRPGLLRNAGPRAQRRGPLCEGPRPWPAQDGGGRGHPGGEPPPDDPASPGCSVGRSLPAHRAHGAGRPVSGTAARRRTDGAARTARAAGHNPPRPPWRWHQGGGFSPMAWRPPIGTGSDCGARSGWRRRSAPS